MHTRYRDLFWQRGWEQDFMGRKHQLAFMMLRCGCVCMWADEKWVQNLPSYPTYLPLFFFVTADYPDTGRLHNTHTHTHTSHERLGANSTLGSAQQLWQAQVHPKHTARWKQYFIWMRERNTNRSLHVFSLWFCGDTPQYTNVQCSKHRSHVSVATRHNIPTLGALVHLKKCAPW